MSSRSSPSTEGREATVLKVIEGSTGYTVAKIDGISEIVTFSHNDVEVWQDSERPKPGSRVILQNIRQYAGGLRALRASFKPVNFSE